MAWIQSHLFRAPLSRILGLVSVAKLADCELEQDGILDLIQSSANELDQVIREVTNKSKTE